MENQKRERRARGKGREEEADKTRNQLQLWTVISAGHLFTKGQLWVDMLICAWQKRAERGKGEGRAGGTRAKAEYLNICWGNVIWRICRGQETHPARQDQDRPGQSRPDQTRQQAQGAPWNDAANASLTALPKSMQNVLLTLHKQALARGRRRSRSSSLPSVTVEHAKG